jgi:FkbM family methyltransferase
MNKRQALPTAPSASFRQRGLLEQAGEQFSKAGLPAGARSWLKSMYYRALMAQTMGRGLASTLPHGEVVRVHPAHRFMTWNPSEYEAFRSVIRPGMVALDVGANVGSYAILLGQWVGAGGKVFAFEPSAAVHEGLVEHIALNQLKEIVYPVSAAIGDKEGSAPFVSASTAGEGRLASWSERSSGSVSMVTIDAFCRAQGITPDFIKIDVEGWELSALRGARETIRRSRGRLALFVEMHPSLWPLIGVSREDVLAELDAQSLRIAPLGPSDDVWSIEGECVRLIAGSEARPASD